MILAIGHKARQGKNTVAELIKEHYKEYDIRLYSFAELLKQEVNEFIGKYDTAKNAVETCRPWMHIPHWVTIEDSPDMTDPLCPYGKYRKLLEFWGTEYRRAESLNYWVKALAKKINQDKPQVAIISDLRFPNEFKWVKSFKRYGITIKVERDGFSEGTDHYSETALDTFTFDYVIKAKSLEELKLDSIEVFKLIKDRDLVPHEFRDWSV